MRHIFTSDSVVPAFLKQDMSGLDQLCTTIVHERCTTAHWPHMQILLGAGLVGTEIALIVLDGHMARTYVCGLWAGALVSFSQFLSNSFQGLQFKMQRHTRTCFQNPFRKVFCSSQVLITGVLSLIAAGPQRTPVVSWRANQIHGNLSLVLALNSSSVPRILN